MQDSPETADATNVEPMRLYEMIGPIELARRLTLPETWVRDRTRLYAADPIPHLKFGKYVRFRWGSPEMEAWLAAHSVVPQITTTVNRITSQRARAVPLMHRTSRGADPF